MTRQTRRMALVLTAVAGVALAVGLILTALRQNIVYFYTPRDLAAAHVTPDQRIRLGGLVEKGSVARDGDNKVTFVVGDDSAQCAVSYQGLLPDLFREGQGIVAEGRLVAPGQFVATTVLAKHDERYMPPGVAEAIKERGEWRGGAVSP